MTRFGPRSLGSLLVLALVVGPVGHGSGSPQPTPPPPKRGPAAAAVVALPAAARTLPSPFQFTIEEMSLKFADRVVLRDRFRRVGRLGPLEMEGRTLALAQAPKYSVELGKLSGVNIIRPGAFRVDHRATTNIWLGPGGTFGHRLHHHDDYVALMTLPVDAAGKSNFIAKEGFPLEYTIKLRKPRFVGFEKIKVGLLELETFKSVAAVSVGRLPFPFPPIVGGGGGGGGGNKFVNLEDMVSNPAIVLGRVEEPDIMGEIILDHQFLEAPAQIETLEMTLRVDREGKVSGLAKVAGATGQVKEMQLASKSQEAFFVKRSTLAGDMKLAATLFVETLPKPAVFEVAPKQVAAAEARGGKVKLRIEGIGFGPDSRLELVREGVTGIAARPVRASALQLERKEKGPEGAILHGEVGLGANAAGSYSVRVTTGGQSVLLRKAVRVN